MIISSVAAGPGCDATCLRPTSLLQPCLRRLCRSSPSARDSWRSAIKYSSVGLEQELTLPRKKKRPRPFCSASLRFCNFCVIPVLRRVEKKQGVPGRGCSSSSLLSKLILVASLLGLRVVRFSCSWQNKPSGAPQCVSSELAPCWHFLTSDVQVV